MDSSELTEMDGNDRTLEEYNITDGASLTMLVATTTCSSPSPTQPISVRLLSILFFSVNMSHPGMTVEEILLEVERVQHIPLSMLHVRTPPTIKYPHAFLRKERSLSSIPGFGEPGFFINICVWSGNDDHVVVVRLPTGEMLDIPDENGSVAEFKAAIREVTGIAVDKQHLSFEETVIDETRSLEEWKIVDYYHTVDLSIVEGR